MKISNILSIGILLFFVIVLLTGRNSIRKAYLLYILYLFPLIDLFLTPVKDGGFTCFDFITYITLFISLFLNQFTLLNRIGSSFPLYVITLLLILILGTLNSEFPVASVINLAKLLAIIFYAHQLLEECHEDPSFIYTVIKALKISCLLSLLFLSLQLAFGLSITIYQLSPNVSQFDTTIRYPSFFQDPQKYGQFLAMTSFLFLVSSPRRDNTKFAVAYFAVVVLALFLTGVRAAFSGLCAGLFIILLFANKRKKLLGCLFIALGYAIIQLYASHFALFNRSTNARDMAAVRYSYWRAAFRIFEKNPLLGIGIGNYQNYVSLHMQNQYWEYFGTKEYMDHPESGYLKILSEWGILAFILGISFIVRPIGVAFKSLISSAGKNQPLIYLIASIVSWLIGFGTVYSFSDVRIYILVITLTCLIITINAKNKSNEVDPRAQIAE